MPDCDCIPINNSNVLNGLHIMTEKQKQAVEESLSIYRKESLNINPDIEGAYEIGFGEGLVEVINNPQRYGLQPINEWVSLCGLRKQFQNETGIAPVFANRIPYINYIKWLEDKLASMAPINEREEG